MRKNLAAYRRHQVFLNYPFDEGFEPFAEAMHFGVVAAGLLPLCAKDLTVPDRPRLEMLVDAIGNCYYSAHDFSRSAGEGAHNFARMNMPIEMGMSLFHAIQTQRQEHRCAFFVPTLSGYKAFASDLAGLDPKSYDDDASVLLTEMYDWLRDVVPATVFSSLPTVEVVQKFEYYRELVARVNGSGKGGKPSHNESQEIMYQVCSSASWWDWRGNKAGREEFPPAPISWKEGNSLPDIR